MAKGKKIRESKTLTEKDQLTLTSWLPDGLTTAMHFDTAEPIEIPVTIGEEAYILREADEAAAAMYKDANLRALQYEQTEDKKVKITGNNGTSHTRALLVSRCLFQIVKDKEGKPTDEMERVPLDDIRGWKPEVVRKIFERIVLISKIKDEEETEDNILQQIGELEGKLALLRKGESHAKNSPSDTTPTSD
jgi:hypothetical protein